MEERQQLAPVYEFFIEILVFKIYVMSDVVVVDED